MGNAIETIAAATREQYCTPASIRRPMRRHKLNAKGLAIMANASARAARLWLLGKTAPSALSRRSMLHPIGECPETIDVFVGRKSG